MREFPLTLRFQKPQDFYARQNLLVAGLSEFIKDDFKKLSEQRPNQSIAKKEYMIRQLENIGKHSITTLPDLDWIFGNLYNLLTQDYHSYFSFWPEQFQINVSNTLSNGVTLAWNGFDFGCSLLMAIYLFRDQENYHQTQNKIKAWMQVASAVMLGAFTYTPWLELETTSGPSNMALAYLVMAATATVDIGNASIDYYNAYKNLSFTGRFEEALRESCYLEQRIKTLEEEIGKHEKHEYHLEKNYFNQKKLKELYGKYIDLQKQMDMDAHYFLANPKIGEMENNIRRNQLQTIFENNTTLQDVEIVQDDNLPFFNSWMNYVQDLEDDIKQQNELLEKCQQKAASRGWRLFMKLVSFVGISLYAGSQFDDSPWLMMPALLLVMTSSVYLGIHQYKHMRKKCLKQHGFFAKSAENAALESDLMLVTVDGKAQVKPSNTFGQTKMSLSLSDDEE